MTRGTRKPYVAPPIILDHDGECETDPDYDGDFCCAIGEAENDQT